MIKIFSQNPGALQKVSPLGIDFESVKAEKTF